MTMLIEKMYEKALNDENINSLPDLTAHVMEEIESIFPQGHGELKKRVVVKIMRNLCSRQKIIVKYSIKNSMTIFTIVSMIDVIAKASNQEYAINKNNKEEDDVYNTDDENDEDINRCISCCFT